MTEKLLDIVDACQNTGSKADFEALRKAVVKQQAYASAMDRMKIELEAQTKQIEALQADAEDWHHANNTREKAEREVARLKADAERYRQWIEIVVSGDFKQLEKAFCPTKEIIDAAALAALALPPIGPHDHPEAQILMWSKTELAAIEEYRRHAFIRGVAFGKGL